MKEKKTSLTDDISSLYRSLYTVTTFTSTTLSLAYTGEIRHAWLSTVTEQQHDLRMLSDVGDMKS